MKQYTFELIIVVDPDNGERETLQRVMGAIRTDTIFKDVDGRIIDIGDVLPKETE